MYIIIITGKQIMELFMNTSAILSSNNKQLLGIISLANSPSPGHTIKISITTKITENFQILNNSKN